MARATVRLDHAGIGAYLRSDPSLAAALERAAASVAERTSANLEAHPPRSGSADVDTSVSPGRTRLRASVVVKHPAAVPLEAKHGILSRAASAAGLDLHPNH